MSHLPFVLLSSRADDGAADDEYASYLEHTGLSETQLVRVRMERGDWLPLDLDDYAGVILGGSPFTGSIPEEMKSGEQRRLESELGVVLDEITARDFPFLGVCFGVGSLVRMRGGLVDGTYGESTGAAHITLTPAGRADQLTSQLPTEFSSFVGHTEGVTTPPPGARVLATSPTAPVQMLRLGTNLYVTQFHPEMDAEALIRRMEYYRYAGYFNAEDFDTIATAARSADVSASHQVLRGFVELFTSSGS